MSKIMDRVFDLSAVDWSGTDPATLNNWEMEALEHDPACRCHKCALFFARMVANTETQVRACAIPAEVINALRKILIDCGKGKSINFGYLLLR